MLNLELTAFNGCDLAELAEDGYALDGLRLEAMSGLVNLYAVFAPEDLEGDGATGAVPTFNFGEEASAAQAEEPARAVIRLAASWEVEGEETSADVLKPQEEYGTLSRGSRGEAVRALQQRLIDLCLLYTSLKREVSKGWHLISE